MKIPVYLYATLVNGIISWLLNFVATCTGSMQEEFGNALRQDTKSVSQTDHDVAEVIKYVQQYTRKRYPWSLPRPSDQGPEPLVDQLRKRNIIYSHDGVSPLYYDDTVQDRSGDEHGITKFFILGTVYEFVLTWKESAIKFCHNFTVSVYQKDHIHIYTHTFFLQNLNVSSPAAEQSKYLFPKVGSSYFKYLASTEQTGEFTYTRDFPSRDSDDDPFNKAQADMPCAGVRGAGLHGAGVPESQSEYVEGYQVSESEKTELYRKVKVMSYNIWNMNSKSTRYGGYTDRMNHLKDTILKSDPDIIALQEVRFEASKGEDLGPCQIHTLSEWLPQYQYVYIPAQMQPNTPYEGRTEEGVAIMSKYPIISHNSIMLFINRSNSADTHQRVLLQADIYIPSVGMVHIFNTHLSLSHEAREKSVVQIWNHVKQQKGPVIVVGDLNAEPHERAIKYLSGQDVFPKEDKSQLIDVWSAMNPKEKGFTFGTLEKKLTKRIDYIFFQPGEVCCEIEACNVIDDGSRGIDPDERAQCSSVKYHQDPYCLLSDILKKLKANSMDPEETARIRRCIWIHVGRKCTSHKAASDHLPVMAVLSLKTKLKHATHT